MAAALQTTVAQLSRIVAPTRSDTDLLRAFTQQADHEAFGAIVERHSGLVRGVCRRVLGNTPSVDDALQATFLVLLRRAKQLVREMSLASWLHGVAYRTALNERRATKRRLAHEQRATHAATPSPERDVVLRELQETLDAEIRRLPDGLREVFIRSCLQQEDSTAVGAALGLNPGTVRSRLVQARQLLQERLTRHGITLSAALTVVALTDSTTSAATLAPLHTLARHVALRLPTPSGLFTKHVEALANLAHPTSWQVKTLAISVLLTCLVGFSMGGGTQETPSKKPPVELTKELTKTEAKGETLPNGAVARLGTTLFRTGYMVSGLAFSPDGQRLASWGSRLYQNDGVSVWDATTGQELQRTLTGENTVLRVAWLSKDTGFVTAGGQGATRRPGPVGEIRSLEFSATEPAALPKGAGGFGFVNPQDTVEVLHDSSLTSDSKMLVVLVGKGANAPVVTVRAFQPGMKLDALKVLATCTMPKERCKTIAVAPDGKHIVGMSAVEKDGKPTELGQVTIWDATGKIVHTLTTPDKAVQWGNFVLATANNNFAVGLGDGDTWVADYATGKGRVVPTGNKAVRANRSSGVMALDLSPDGQLLATGGMSEAVHVTDIASGKRVAAWTQTSFTQAVVFSPDGRRVASGGQDGIIRVWDVAKNVDAVPTPGHRGTIWHVSLSADGQRTATSGGDGTLRVWDATGKELVKIETKEDVRTCRIAADGQQVFAILGEHNQPKTRLVVYDVATGKDVTPEGFKKDITAGGLAWTPDGKTLLTHAENKISAWEWPSAKQRWSIEMPKPANPQGINHVDHLCVAPDGKTFITVAHRSWYREEKGLRFGYGADGVVDVFDLATGQRIHRLIEAQSTFRGGLYTPDGMFIHSGSGILKTDSVSGQPYSLPNFLCVIDPLTGRFVRAFTQPPRVEGVNSGHNVALSADGRVLFRVTTGRVQAYEVLTGKFRTAWQGHRETAYSLATPSRNVRRVVSGSLDTSAIVWDTQLHHEAKELSVAERAEVWETLAGVEAETTYHAMQRLTGDAAKLLPFLTERLKPTPQGPKLEELQPLFRDLDSPRFAVREKASAALDKFGEGALELVREQLAKTSDAEARERLTRFVAKYNPSVPSSTWMQHVRTLEVLEHLATPEAKTLLKQLAEGGPSRLTTEAKKVVQRLETK